MHLIGYMFVEKYYIGMCTGVFLFHIHFHASTNFATQVKNANVYFHFWHEGWYVHSSIKDIGMQDDGCRGFMGIML